MCIERSNGSTEPQQCNGLLAKANDHKKNIFSVRVAYVHVFKLLFSQLLFQAFCNVTIIGLMTKRVERRKGYHR